MAETIKEAGRMVAGAYYDYQIVRQGSMNRIRDIIRKKNENIPFDKLEEKKEKKYSKEYSDANLDKLLEKMKVKKKLTKKEYEYLKKTLELEKRAEKLENKYKSAMIDYISSEPIWNGFLSRIRGLGAVLGANLIKSFGYCDQIYDKNVKDDKGNIIHEKGEEKCPHVSSLWKLCGLHTEDGKAPKRERGKKLSYNLKLKTMMWKVGDSLIKQNSPVYREVYDREKRKYRKKHPKPINRVVDKKGKPVLNKNGKPIQDYTNMHIHLMAMRKMCKLFLEHYWVFAREQKGLPIGKPYAHDKLGHRSYISWQNVIEAQEKAKGL